MWINFLTIKLLNFELTVPTYAVLDGTGTIEGINLNK